MKYILSLSINYIKRQKFRTVLTFLGIMLASFIMGISLFTASSFFSSYKNYIYEMDGTWEVFLSGLSEEDAVIEKLKKNVLVENLFCYKQTLLRASENSMSTDDNNCIEVTINDSDVRKAAVLYQTSISGDDAVPGKLISAVMNNIESENGIYLPSYLKKDGYSEGDTVKISVVPVTDGKRGSAVSETFTVEGFVYSPNDYVFSISVPYSCEFAERLNSENPDIIEDTVFSDSEAYFRINDKADFDESIKSVLYELFGDEYKYSDLVYDSGLNSQVLILELKTLVNVGNFVVIAAIVFLFIFLVWLVARFIIDNTFEISVAERNRKYSLLKTLGASRRQLGALTVFEALFFCLTAVSAGVIVSYFIVRYLFVSFAESGIKQAVFEVHPIIIAGAFLLCTVSVFISSYTSALWPTRKMTLVEAMNYGVSGKNPKKTQKIKKTGKLHRSPSGLIKLYTKRNIERTKGKFIFSVFAGSVSVLMLVAMIMSTMLLEYIIKPGTETAETAVSDYEYYELNDFRYSEISEYFDSEYFSAVRYQGRNSYMRYSEGLSAYNPHFIDSQTADIIDSLSGVKNTSYQFGAVSEGCFMEPADVLFGVYSSSAGRAKSVSELSEMSYEQLRDSGESILFIVGKSGNRYRKLSKPAVITDDETEYRISGICYIKNEYGPEEFNDAIIYTAAENAADTVFSSVNLNLQFAGTEVSEKCYEICSRFEKENCVYQFADMYMGGTGAIGLMKATEKTELVFFVFLWLTGIVSMINLTNTRMMNSQREYFILRCTGMTRKQLVKCALQEVIIFSVLCTVTGIAAGILLFLSAVGGTAVAEEMVTSENPAEVIRNIADATLLPVLSAAGFSLVTNIVIPAAFAAPLIKRMFTTSAEIVNSNDLR